MTGGSVSLDTVVSEMTAFVDPWGVHDLTPVGLQVRASDDPEIEVTKVALAVSATREMTRAAADWGAQVLLTHHGMFWGRSRPGYDPQDDPAYAWDEARVDLLRDLGVSLISYHIALDAHAEVGNNAELARLTGLRPVAMDIGEFPGDTTVPLGLRAVSDVPLTADELGQRVAAVTGTDPIVIDGRRDSIRDVVIISGGAARHVYEAIDREMDAFITGEGELWAYDLAHDAGITFIAFGHHASERYGVIALGSWLERRFGVETRFFDEANPF